MDYLETIGKKAANAKHSIQLLSANKKNAALKKIAENLIKNYIYILNENDLDIQAGESIGMHPGLIDRLRLTKERIEAMAEGALEVATLRDPVGELLDSFTRPNGLIIEKKRVPLGVIGIIYESRPNVTLDAFALCFKAGNTVVLKGGKDAIHSNIAITKVIRDTLKECNINENAVQLIENTDREITSQFMKLDQYIDVLIPRGGAGLIRSVVQNSTIPVIQTGTGNCHIYVDKDANLDMALSIILNAKTQRIGVCNACESLVVHQDILSTFLPLFSKKMDENNVEIRADKTSLEYIKNANIATDEDFKKEYLDYIISVKTVGSIDEAISHINQYNTQHSETIITENKATAQKFLNEIDAACVYVNASTRFTDGFEFGFGAEIGISTQKLHARGPMGLKELTSYKYMIMGSGQIRN